MFGVRRKTGKKWKKDIHSEGDGHLEVAELGEREVVAIVFVHGGQDTRGSDRCVGKGDRKARGTEI